jgi:hypothetical protein
VPRKHTAFRLSDLACQTLEEYRARFELGNLTEALEKILQRHRYLDTLGFNAEREKTDEEITCTRRILHDGAYYCIKPASPNTLPKEKELMTLVICEVCKKQRLGLTEKTLVRSEAETESSPHSSMVAKSTASLSKTPFSYGSDRAHSQDPFDKPAPPRPQGFHCPLGKNATYCYNNLCDQRGTCKTQVQRS